MRTGVKGLLAIPAFFFILWIGGRDMINKHEIYILYFLVGIMTVVVLHKFVLKYSEWFARSAGIFILTITVIGLTSNIPQVDNIIEKFETPFGIVLWYLIGLFLAGSFRIYSEQDPSTY